MKKNRTNWEKDTTETEKTIAFTSGNIVTMDPEIDNPEVLIIQNNRIVDVGDKEILKSYDKFE